jgi:NAD(P)-dependent dehydrogenase (short-subunit alcohol dehydrogenase family)
MNRRVLVTGGSRGIGLATARLLRDRGWSVAIVARSPADLAAWELESGLDHPAVSGDVTDYRSVEAAVARLAERWGGLDALVCAAGTGSFGPTESLPLEAWHSQIDVNLTGTFHACRAVLPGMLAQGHGHLLNVLSVASTRAFPQSAGYVASKWGAYGLTLGLAEEFRGRGIRVTALLPGSTDTPFWDSLGGAPFAKSDMLSADQVAQAALWSLESPAGVSVDEIRILPPKGIL